VTLVTEKDSYVAVAWFHDVSNLMPGAVMVHGAAAENYRGRWVSFRTMGEILGQAFDDGAVRLYAHCPSEFIANFWKRLGFHLEHHETEGLLAYKDRDEWQAT
jgi:GNAT superfamily N-acetyltransferase